MFTKAQIKDIPTIQQLARSSWEAAYKNILSHEQIEYMLSTMYASQEIENQISSSNHNYYLISDKNELNAGFIGFELDYEPSTTKLHKIYLIPEAKGKGLGKAALHFVIEKAMEKGNNRVILNVNKYNPSLKFYESQGFKIYDEGVFDIGSGYVMDDYLMEHLI